MSAALEKVMSGSLRRGKVERSDMIVLLSAAPLYTPKSPHYGRYVQIRTGMTVDEYVALCPDEKTAAQELIWASKKKGRIGFVAAKE